MLATVSSADAIVVCPSNPVVSVGPILGLPGMREAWVPPAPEGGREPDRRRSALKGPADKMLLSLGHEVSATGVAAMYAGLVDGMVVDTVDGDERAGIEDLGMRVLVTDAVMRDCRRSHAPRPGDAGVRRGDGGALSPASGVSTVVPVKDLQGTKSRLAPILDPGARAGLTLYMMGRVVAAIKKAGVEDICVVSPDRIVLNEAQGRGAKPLLQESRGLNPALEEGRRRALELGASTLLVFPADLPLLEADDVRAVLQAAEEHSVVISPDGVRPARTRS